VASETTAESTSGTGAEITPWGTTNEAGLGFTVLTNINKTTHQALVAERIHGVLRLVSVCIFHNPASLRHSIRKKQNIGKENFSSLSHKILKVMPLDIIRKVTHIDPAVLLG